MLCLSVEYHPERQVNFTRISENRAVHPPDLLIQERILKGKAGSEPFPDFSGMGDHSGEVPAGVLNSSAGHPVLVEADHNRIDGLVKGPAVKILYHSDYLDLLHRKCCQVPPGFVGQMSTDRRLQAEFPDSGLINDDRPQMVTGPLQVEKPSFQELQSIDISKIGINTVMSETDVLLPDLERFIVPGVSWIALGKGHLEDIWMPEEFGLDDVSLLPEAFEPRLRNNNHIFAAESEILALGKPNLVRHSKSADKQDNSHRKLEHDQGFAEKGSFFTPCYLSLPIRKAQHRVRAYGLSGVYRQSHLSYP